MVVAVPLLVVVVLDHEVEVPDVVVEDNVVVGVVDSVILEPVLVELVVMQVLNRRCAT